MIRTATKYFTDKYKYGSTFLQAKSLFFFKLLAEPEQRHKARLWVDKKLFIFIKFSTNLTEI